MDFSLPAWLGGLAGTIVAVALYVPAIRIFEQQSARAKRSADARTAHGLRGQALGHAPGDFGRSPSRSSPPSGYWIGNVVVVAA